MRVTLIWVGMAAILLFGYGLIGTQLVKAGWSTSLVGWMFIALAGGLVYAGVYLTKRERSKARR